MAVIALISCNTTEDPYPVYPLGLTMVAAAARARGHEVWEWDLFADGGIGPMAGFIGDKKPDYIGLSLRNVDSVNYNKPDSYIGDYKKVVQALRQITTAPLVLGGPAYTIFPEHLLDELQADYGVAGEGEQAFCALIDQLEKDRAAADRIIKNKAVLAGHEFSAHQRNARLAGFYLQKGGMLSVQTKRGCPHRCAYCSYPVLEGRRYRFRPAEDVVDEIELLVKKHGADYFSITDSVFNDSSGHYLQIAEQLVRRNLQTPWMCFLRPERFTADEVQLLKRAGLSSIEWGTDCSTDTTLRAMRKGFDWELVVHANNLFAAAEISSAHFIIFGGPQETHETVDQGLKNLENLQRCVIFAGIGVRIFPDTQIHQWALQEGVISGDQNLLPPTFYFSPQVDSGIIHEKILKSFAGRSDRIYPDGQFVDKTRALHLFGQRGPAWDLLLKKRGAGRRR